MKMRLYAAFAAVVGLGITAALVGVVGCETRSAGEAENYFDNNPYESIQRDEPGVASPSIAPDSPELTFDDEMAVLYARGGVPPYSWRVVYPARGTIVRYGQGGGAIVYKRIEEPDQIIILSDSAGSAVQVTVSQPEESAEAIAASRLSIDVDPLTLDQDGDLAICTARGGTPPYTWSTSGASGTILGTSTGRQVIYQRDMPGDVAITVTDATRRTVSVIVSQPEPAQP
jgi:hypothetical protein